MKKKLLFLVIILIISFVIFSNIKGTKERDMSLTINIYYTGENGNARKFAEEMEQSGTAAAIRAEKGNLKYEYFYPLNDKETVLLIDSWENQEAIDVHHQTPMMNKITELRNKYDLHMRVERYVSNEDIPNKDKAFIRQ
jgi:quinol monooxygenase YgiN